jgi:ribosome modulation factor
MVLCATVNDGLADMTTDPPISRDTPAARRGRWAYLDGMAIDDCPYSGRDYAKERREWMAGWLDAATAEKFPDLFPNGT